MTPRKRSRKNKDLPQNLYVSIKGGVAYYKYRHPVTAVWHAMGTNKAAAVAAARQRLS